MMSRCFLCLLVLLVTGSLSSVYAGLSDNNLIEFSIGSYAETFGKLPLYAILWPPVVKVYQDGKVIRHMGGQEGPYYVSQMSPERLDSLKKRLAGEEYLSRTRYIDMDGDIINIHGGVSYIRYLDGDKEVLLATDVKPRGGPWVQLTDEILKYVRADLGTVYYPNVIGVYTSEDTSPYGDQNPPAWPFGEKIMLSPKLKTISDPKVIEYLFDDLQASFSMYAWEFKQGRKRYSLILANSPGWFAPDYLNKALTEMRKNGYRVKE